MRSEHALAEAADWFFRDDFLTQTQSRLVFPLADRLRDAQILLHEALQERPLGRYLILHGAVSDLVTGAIHLTDDGLEVDVLARGRLLARIHDLENIRTRRKIDPDSTDSPGP